jgi:hypothetical protein
VVRSSRATSACAAPPATRSANHPPEAFGHALTRGQLRVRLGERAPALGAAVAPLAPHQPGHSPADRQIAHAHQWALLDPHLAAAAVSASGGAREQLDLRVELLTRLSHCGHDKAIQPDETGSVVLHPLFLLAPRSLTTRSLKGAADVSVQPLNSGRSADMAA